MAGAVCCGGEKNGLFTGIVQEQGRVAEVVRKGGSLRLRIECARVREQAAPGDSVSVNGVCLTVDHLGAGAVTMDVGEETFARTTLSDLRPGQLLNLEPALRVGDPLGGHIVSGHVDAVSRVRSMAAQATQTVARFELPEGLKPLVAPKGSITVDGVSLTVGETGATWFSVFLIPHTLANTTLETLAPGRRVNLEADVLARYVVNALKHSGGGAGGDLNALLKEYGYMKS